MSKQQFNLHAKGRKLFESEKEAVNAFAVKYAPDAPQLSDQEAKELMIKERRRIEQEVRARYKVSYVPLQKKRP